MSRTRPFCLSIAGHDPCAGAGTLADAKVFHHLKVQGLYVLTCNTIQNDHQFERIDWIDPTFVLQQLDLTLDTYQPKYVKIGLIENLDFLQVVLNRLGQQSDRLQVVWDPILTPTASNSFDASRLKGKLHVPENLELFATPNRKEFNYLGEAFFEQFQGIYIKNGDGITHKGVDQFSHRGKTYTLNPKIETELTKHGTGCTFSSAMIAHLALNYPALKAVFRSKRLTEKLLMSTTTQLGHLY